MRINMLQTILYYYYYYLNKSVFMYVYAGTLWQSIYIYIYTHNEMSLDIYFLMFNYIKEKL